jgi:hypothetical protein
MHISSPSMRMRPPRPRAVLPQVMDAAAKLSVELGAVGKPIQDALLRDETSSANWPVGSSSMLAHARPHTIFR